MVAVTLIFIITERFQKYFDNIQMLEIRRITMNKKLNLRCKKPITDLFSKERKRMVEAINKLEMLEVIKEGNRKYISVDTVLKIINECKQKIT